MKGCRCPHSEAMISRAWFAQAASGLNHHTTKAKKNGELYSEIR
jgi:hypothetical protein